MNNRFDDKNKQGNNLIDGQTRNSKSNNGIYQLEESNPLPIRMVLIPKINYGQYSFPESEFLYRGDSRNFNNIFKHGFKARGAKTDLIQHSLGFLEDINTSESAYISTSTSKEAAIKFPYELTSADKFTYLYQIHAKRSDIIHTADALSPQVFLRNIEPEDHLTLIREGERTIPLEIKTREIRGGWQVKIKRIEVENPIKFSQWYKNMFNENPSPGHFEDYCYEYTRTIKEPFNPNPNYIPPGIKPWVNNTFRAAGLGLTTLGATLDGMSWYDEYQISTFSGDYNNTYKETARIAGGWTGASLLGARYAKIGAELCPKGYGTLVCGFGGGLVGSIIGYFGGSTITTSLYDAAVDNIGSHAYGWEPTIPDHWSFQPETLSTIASDISSGFKRLGKIITLPESVKSIQYESWNRLGYNKALFNPKEHLKLVVPGDSYISIPVKAIIASKTPIKETAHYAALLSAGYYGSVVGGKLSIGPCSALGLAFPPAAPVTVPVCTFMGSLVGGGLAVVGTEMAWQKGSEIISSQKKTYKQSHCYALAPGIISCVDNSEMVTAGFVQGNNFNKQISLSNLNVFVGTSLSSKSIKPILTETLSFDKVSLRFSGSQRAVSLSNNNLSFPGTSFKPASSNQFAVKKTSSLSANSIFQGTSLSTVSIKPSSTLNPSLALSVSQGGLLNNNLSLPGASFKSTLAPSNSQSFGLLNKDISFSSVSSPGKFLNSSVADLTPAFKNTLSVPHSGFNNRSLAGASFNSTLTTSFNNVPLALPSSQSVGSLNKNISLPGTSSPSIFFSSPVAKFKNTLSVPQGSFNNFSLPGTSFKPASVNPKLAFGELKFGLKK